MVFTSTIFLFAFLPLAMLAYYVVPARWRAAPLLLTSAVFYAWGEPVLVVLILLTGLFTFCWGRLLVQAQEPRTRRLAPDGRAVPQATAIRPRHQIRTMTLLLCHPARRVVAPDLCIRPARDGV